MTPAFTITATHPTNGETITKYANTKDELTNKIEELERYYPECNLTIDKR